MIPRCDFVYLFDVKDGNPNGDPDAGNLPRVDPETGHGLVTDVCLKRKVRNWIDGLNDNERQIFVRHRVPLNPLIAESAAALGKPTYKVKAGWDGAKSKLRSQAEIYELQAWMCNKYYDIRAFGAVMSTGPNAGQIRGPLQLAMSRSIDPIVSQEHAITRLTDVDKEEGEMGRKFTVPYGLYRVHGFINPHLAEKTGFSAEDLSLFWKALEQMFEADRSAARGEMAPQTLVVFEHDSALGNAPANKLFDRVAVSRRADLGDAPPRSFKDYDVSVDDNSLPAGISIKRLI